MFYAKILIVYGFADHGLSLISTRNPIRSVLFIKFVYVKYF